MSSKMNTHMLSIKADVIELLLKQFRSCLKDGKETEARNLLYEIRVQSVQANEYFPTLARETSEEEIPTEHDLHYAGR